MTPTTLPRLPRVFLLRRALLAVVLALCVAAPASADAPSSRLPVLARGLNLAHWLRFPPSADDAALENYLDDADLASIRRAGFTYVRLAVGVEVVMQGRHIAPDKLAVIVRVIRRLQKAGLAVMTDPYPQGGGNWQLDKNPEAQQILLGYWRDLAPALKRLPVGLTFPELVNEPMSDPAAWTDLQARLLRVIRTALPDNTIVLTGTGWSSIDGLLKVQPVADRNVIYSFHTYEPSLLTLLGFWDKQIDKNDLAAHIPFPTSPQACHAAAAAARQDHDRGVIQYWCSHPQNETTLESDLRRATDWGHAHQVTVMITEIGAVGILNRPARDAYFSAMHQAATNLRLPWALWALDDQMGFDRPVGRPAGSFRYPADVVAALRLNP